MNKKKVDIFIKCNNKEELNKYLNPDHNKIVGNR